MVGGRWADHVVKKWIRKRGRRVPEDRLKSCAAFAGLEIPECMLEYGWTLEKAVGSIPVPVSAMFLQGLAQFFLFSESEHLLSGCSALQRQMGRSCGRKSYGERSL